MKGVGKWGRVDVGSGASWQILSFSVSFSAWCCGYRSGGHVWFHVTHSCVGGLAAGSGGSACLIGNALSPYPHPHSL